jgi:16S rRNA G527 N7-methylase RsmG
MKNNKTINITAPKNIQTIFKNHTISPITLFDQTEVSEFSDFTSSGILSTPP